MKDDFRFDDELENDGQEQGNNSAKPEPASLNPDRFQLVSTEDFEQQKSPEQKPLDFVLGDDFQLKDVPVQQPVKEQKTTVSSVKKKKKPKQKGCLWSLIWIGIVAAVSIGLALSVIMVFQDVLAIGKSSTDEIEVEIKQGMTTREIAEVLKDDGVISHPIVFVLYSKLTKKDGTFQYGVYYLKPSYGYSGIIEKLQNEGQKAETVSVQIPSGATVDEISKLLEEKGVCSVDHFMTAMTEKTYDFKFLKDVPAEKVYYYLEGYLYPDTYSFYPNDTVEGAFMTIKKMLSNLDGKLTDAMYTRAKQVGFNMNEIMTFASIVELEASGLADEMPKVAAVFINRYKWTDQPNLLGSTPTAEYPHGSGRYNTNKVEGLPPGPLCSPDIRAIEAVLYPKAEFPYYYFVTDSNMKFYYNKTLSEHESTISKLKRQGLWE